MNRILFTVLCTMTFVSAMTQPSFDSMAVSSKVRAQLAALSQSLPIMSTMKETSRRIEQRVDYTSSSFDFKRSDDPVYLSQHSRKVLVSRFPDMKHSGCHVYVQNGTTMYPLSNLELHADESGKIVRNLPFQEIQQARVLLDSRDILSLDQAKAVLRKEGKADFRFSHARLILDLSTSTAVWQLLGDPDWKANRQESMEVDAFSGRFIRQQSNAINLSSASNQR